MAGSSPPPGRVQGQRQQVTDDKEVSEKLGVFPKKIPTSDVTTQELTLSRSQPMAAM